MTAARIRVGARLLAQIFIGLVVGAALLWLAMRWISADELRLAAAAVETRWLAAAAAIYWLSMASRIVRWKGLLRPFAPLPLASVGNALLIGYALNTLIPARLGELLRADLCARFYGIPRGGALGSILLERWLDAAAVVLALGVGLAVAPLRAGAQQTAVSAAIAGGVICAGVAFVLIAARSLWSVAWVARWPAVGRFIRTMADALAGLPTASLAAAATATCAIWALDAATIWSVVRGLGIELAPGEAAVVLGVVALAALLPSAPGFVGSYQFAFVLILDGLGYSAAHGVLAATLIQVWLLAPMTLAGIILFLRGRPNAA